MSTIQRRTHNHISRLKDENGTWIEDPKKLTEHIIVFYHSLFQETRSATDFSFYAGVPAGGY
ncbi:hypothetical protein LINPERPRIM_LOCUS17568 [Linum perenne]